MSFTTKAAISKLSKLGEVQRNGRNYWVEYNGHIISGWEQDGRSTHLTVRSKNDHDDPQTDYYAGSYCRNIAMAIYLATH
jgi:hypothetical protein